MSIAAFYRTYVPFVQSYSYFSEGDPVEVQTPPTWIKVNIQPWKTGIVLDLETQGTIFKDWRAVYARTIPVYDMTGIPEGATLLGTYYYYGGQWFTATATQDWTTPGRAPKHYKYQAIASTGQGAITWPEPIPLATLVEQFENVVWELQQVTPLIVEVLN